MDFRAVSLGTISGVIPPFYALVRRGGGEEGCKPRTKLAFIELTVKPENNSNHHMGVIITMAGVRTKTLRVIYFDDVLARWDWEPDKKEIRDAKKAIRVIAYAEENLNT